MGTSTLMVDTKLLPELIPIFKMCNVQIVGSRESLAPNTVTFVISGSYVPDCPRVRAEVSHDTDDKLHQRYITVEFMPDG